MESDDDGSRGCFEEDDDEKVENKKKNGERSSIKRSTSQTKRLLNKNKLTKRLKGNPLSKENKAKL